MWGRGTVKTKLGIKNAALNILRSKPLHSHRTSAVCGLKSMDELALTFYRAAHSLVSYLVTH